MSSTATGGFEGAVRGRVRGAPSSPVVLGLLLWLWHIARDSHKLIQLLLTSTRKTVGLGMKSLLFQEKC